MIFSMKMLMKILRMRRKSSATNIATPSAPAVALEDEAEISSTLQQRISCSSSDEYDQFPDLKVNPIRMIRIKLKFQAKCIESRQKKSAESSKDATGKGVPEIRYDSNDVIPLESLEETDEEHLTGGIGNISNKPTSRYDTSTGSTARNSVCRTVGGDSAQSSFKSNVTSKSHRPTRLRNAQPSTARKPSTDEQVPVIHSAPSLIMHLARGNKLRKTYKMEKQGGMRMGAVERLPTTRVGWFVYSLRVLASDPYIRAFSAW
jgi:hypothetical protein